MDEEGIDRTVESAAAAPPGDASVPGPRASEAAYRSLAELSPDAIFVNLDGRFVYANAAAAQILGAARPADLVGRAPFDFLLPEFHAAVRERIGRILGDGASQPVMLQRWRRLDGTPVEVEATAGPVDWDGRRAVQVLLRDISQRVRTEDALRETAQTLQSFYDNVPLLMGVVELPHDDRDIRHVYDNSATERFFGHAPGSTTGRWASDIGVPPGVVGAWIVRYRESERLGQPVRFEYEHPRGDGRTVNLSCIVSRIGRVDGATRFSYITEDVTERREFEARLQESESRLRESERRLAAVLDNASVAVFVMDERQHCTYMNHAAERLTGYRLGETLGRPLHDVVHHTHPDGTPYPLADCPIDRAFPEQNCMQGEEVFVHRDGSFYPVAFTASPIRDEESRTVGTIIEVRDIRAERAARQALLEADRRKDEFLATLAHELRNPLAPLRTAAHVLRSGNLPEPQRAAAHAMIERQVGTMARLVDDLLEVSRLTLGRIELQRARVSLAVAIEQAVEAAQAAVAAGRHRLEIHACDPAPWVDGDLTRLAQVFTNLLTNAAKYTPPGGTIEVDVATSGGDAVVRVRDSGVGIPRDMLGRVFEMFAQVPRSGAMSQGGLGIGLALAQRIVTLHGGVIEARSDGEGRGSEFSVRLPLVAAPRDDACPGGAASAADAPGRRVLVVDDNVDAAESVALLLGLQGHSARTAHSGEEALALLDGERFDVVLLDIGLPGLDGYTVARRIRERLGAGSPLLVALTGWGKEHDRQLAAEAGFDHHLTKPADPEQVARLVDGAGPAPPASSG